MDGQWEGRSGEGLGHGVASITSICRGCHGGIFLQGSQSGCVCSIVSDRDVPSSIQAGSGWDALDVVGHGVDGSDWTALGKEEGQVNWI